jgi:hypothetical protein
LKNPENITENSQKNYIKSRKILPQIAADFYQSCYAPFLIEALPMLPIFN